MKPSSSSSRPEPDFSETTIPSFQTVRSGRMWGDGAEVSPGSNRAESAALGSFRTMPKLEPCRAVGVFRARLYSKPITNRRKLHAKQ